MIVFLEFGLVVINNLAQMTSSDQIPAALQDYF